MNDNKIDKAFMAMIKSIFTGCLFIVGMLVGAGVLPEYAGYIALALTILLV